MVYPAGSLSPLSNNSAKVLRSILSFKLALSGSIFIGVFPSVHKKKKMSSKAVLKFYPFMAKCFASSSINNFASTDVQA